ncbi:hypothetical protein GYH30_055129 [Glycine max]|nr:hypothetical protein GYH30_055129 [Glycine max]
MEGKNMSKVIKLVNEIASISEYKPPVKKQYCNLARRLKLSTPMFEEIRDMKKDALPEDTSNAVLTFKEALQSARELLKFGSEGSKLYLVMTCRPRSDLLMNLPTLRKLDSMLLVSVGSYFHCVLVE